MKKRNNTISRFEDDDEEFNPLAYVVNLADLMLVFACGLMVSLMLSWSGGKILPSELKKVIQMKEVTNQSEKIKGQAVQGKGELQKVGEAYKDPNTGKIFIIEK
ncbi:MAG: DUF2149 domain-containing protein [Thermoanaerobacteraceae bacterium]|jgi:hypothetical protein|nr:DUF2149 domain-containing protein [Thermoanaerobacteraceae bacterium]